MKVNQSLDYGPNIAFYLPCTKQQYNQRTEHTLKTKCNNTCMRTHYYTQKKYHIIFTQYFSWHQENNSLTSVWEDHYAES